jgi:hypothetical protein
VIAALFVQRNGVYYGLPDVDPWDEERDARLYPGPWPVVAHPPCARWSRLAGLVEAVHGYKRAEDGGCFASAVDSVRRWGGVLEHPAYSDAFAAFGLPRPSPGGWQRGTCGGWSAHVEQWHYGHRAKKATWLYAHGAQSLPSLRWGRTPDSAVTAYVTDGGGDVKMRGRRALVSWCGNHLRGQLNDRPRLSKTEASRTPLEFRDVLLAIARSVTP